MAYIDITMRGSNTDNVATANEASFKAYGIAPDLTSVGDEEEFVGGRAGNRSTALWTYHVVCIPFSVRDNEAVGAEQDYGDYKRLKKLLLLNDYLWLYAVSGAMRVDEDDNPFWDNASLPLSVVVVGDPRSQPDFTTGALAFEFDLRLSSLTFS